VLLRSFAERQIQSLNSKTLTKLKSASP